MMFPLRKRRLITTSKSKGKDQRLEAIRSMMLSARLDALLVTDIVNVRYATGFSGTNGVCIITRQKQFFITDRRYTEQAFQEVMGFEIIIAKQDIFISAAQKKIFSRGQRVGFESRSLSVDLLKNIKNTLPGVRFVPEMNIFDSVTAVKDGEELDLIADAVRITDRVFEKAIDVLKPGVRECDVAAEISYWHRKYGAECDAFDPIVASGTRSALPHARASEKKMEKGDAVVLDFGCRYRGYHSDMTRTVFIGKPAPKMKQIYRVVLDAQMKAIGTVRSGVCARSVDSSARNHIKKKGYGRFFVHSLGHGLGIRNHERLRLSMYSRSILQNGNVVTVEPGIYLPGLGGVRIEDDIVVGNDGCKVLNKTEKRLIVV